VPPRGPDPAHGLAASAAGDAGDAYFYMGEYQLAGGTSPWRRSTAAALASSQISPIQRSGFQAAADEVRDYLASTRQTAD